MEFILFSIHRVMFLSLWLQAHVHRRARACVNLRCAIKIWLKRCSHCARHRTTSCDISTVRHANLHIKVDCAICLWQWFSWSMFANYLSIGLQKFKVPSALLHPHYFSSHYWLFLILIWFQWMLLIELWITKVVTMFLNDRWPHFVTVVLCPSVVSVVCLSVCRPSVVKWFVLPKNCLNKQIGNGLWWIEWSRDRWP